ncbi:unnamed protein product [Staurois parvus]|uniref:Uncharacterized protein n=1 Tax=Staurois parvus TaxID=386267 RepID=A0ABN9AT61_9NEOB|nr:unnamed protein product [Staurois parvus]
MGPVPPPLAAARPVICHGPPYRLLMLPARPVICTWDPVPASSMLLPGQSVLMGPCTASHCCCLHRPHSAMCLFQVSSTLLVGSILS